ncbi:MAG: transcriptional regulator [Phycisphaerae bacterium]|jgi:DNA-binding transcriptional regulator GbsR (MarR family)|nr:transcriptional regulator [Phycisphaerae bacterium]
MASEGPISPAEDKVREESPDELRRSKEAFISHWGEMGSSWGVPRSMAEIHALLFIEGRPLCADEIMDRLQVSRGNVSTTLRQLADWGIVTRVRLRGDRKDHFQAEQDVWTLLSLIVRARKRRELEPLLAALDDASSIAREDVASAADPRAAKEHLARLESMQDALKRLDRLSDRFIGRGGKGLDVAVRLLTSLL